MIAFRLPDLTYHPSGFFKVSVTATFIDKSNVFLYCVGAGDSHRKQGSSTSIKSNIL
jgi:hypothetical protein